MNRSRVLNEVVDYLNSSSSYIMRKYEIIEQSSIIDDIDILISKENEDGLWEILKKNNFKRKVDSRLFNNYLYGSKPHTHYRSSDHNLHFDVVNHLSHKSTFSIARPGLSLSYWIPLDETIQRDIWLEKETYHYADFNIPIFAPIFELIHLLCHVIFDKNGEVDHYYTNKINRLINTVDLDRLKNYLELVFFNFSDELIKLCSKGSINLLYSEYISYRDY